MGGRLASPPAEPLEALLFLQSLAQAGWAEADLGLLGRKIGRILRSAPADFASQARKHGLTHVRILILSASTASHLADALIGTAIRFKFLLDVTIAEYEEPEPWLERNRRELKEDPPDFVLLASDNRMLKLSSPLGDEAAATQMVEGALARISRIAEVAGAATGRPVILQTLAGDPDAIQFNMDLGLPGSPRFLTDEFNRRLVQRARQDSRLVLDVNALASLVGHSAWSAGRYWYAAKYPFATNMVPLYADNFMRIIAAQMGRSRRVLVLDLDNTLWGGIVGDDGIEGLALGSGSPLGEAHSALQRMALSLKERGIILCISSKNDETIALDAFRNHPEMILKEDDIVAFRINWEDKAANIKVIADAIDLGLDSFVFLDDNPAERKRVRDALRAAQLERIGDHDEYLRSLGMTLSIAPFDGAGRKRIAQLISKSNQFNLTTRRYSEAEIAAMQSNSEVFTIQARLEDIFGDNGMISAVICRQTGRCWEVDTWIMSCRVLGRRVEETLLQYLVEQARSRGITEIIGRYIPTAKNGLVRDHFSRLGFIQTASQNGETSWQLAIAGYGDKNLPLKVALPRD